MKFVIATVLLVFSVALEAAESTCEQALGSAGATSHNMALTELAQGYISLEQMRIQGVVSASVRQAIKSALDSKRLQIIDIIGSESEFNRQFATVLAPLTAANAVAANTQRVQKKLRHEKEAAEFGNWAESKVLFGSKNKIESMNFNSNGQLLAVKVGKGHRLNILDTENFKLQHSFELEPDESTWSIEFSPDSQSLLVSHGHEVRLYDLTTGEYSVLVYAEREPYKAQFSPDGQHVLMTCSYEALLISRSDIQNVKYLNFFNGNNIFRTAFFSHDSQNIIIANSDDIKIWNILGAEVARLAGDSINFGSQFKWANFSHDKSKVITVRSESANHSVVETWDWQKYADKSFFARFKKKPKPVQIIDHLLNVFDAPFASSGKLLFTTDSGFLTYDSFAGTQKNYDFESESKVVSTAFSPDFRQLLIATEKSKIYLWDMKLMRQTDEFDLEQAVDLQFSVDGRQLFLLQKNGRLSILTRQSSAETN
jgi:WD40 repeat protein